MASAIIDAEAFQARSDFQWWSIAHNNQVSACLNVASVDPMCNPYMKHLGSLPGISYDILILSWFGVCVLLTFTHHLLQERETSTSSCPNGKPSMVHYYHFFGVVSNSRRTS